METAYWLFLTTAVDCPLCVIGALVAADLVGTVWGEHKRKLESENREKNTIREEWVVGKRRVQEH